ncbi:MAG: glycosyltransferase family 4 protein [Planktomarina sp.]
MSDPKRNAAIWYVADGYARNHKQLNGRRVAGDSFLRGFLKHADIPEVQGIVGGNRAEEEFKQIVQNVSPQRSVNTLHSYTKAAADVPSCVNYPAPNLGPELWRRYHYGQTAYSITGVTHTTATTNIMSAMFNLRTAPCEDWDGIFCTSKAVIDQVRYQFDLFDEYAAKKFGTATPKRPRLFQVPLGIHTDEYTPTDAHRVETRKKFGIGDDDVAFMVLSRLSSQEKFDPIPMYRALSLAQKETGKNVHMILCGYFGDKLSEDVFRKGASNAMPNVKLHVLNGKEAEDRMCAFGAADAFVFPIDNIQETFGLAPIEAMAAGLPVIASDWDGLRDTVTDEVGYKIPTLYPGADILKPESLRYQLEVDTYPQYTTLNASMTVIDVPLMAKAMVDLIANPDLRNRMGRAGLKRAKTVYDWSNVIPQMQDVWEELASIRLNAAASENTIYEGAEIPISPNSGHLFASYPTNQGGMADILLTVSPGANLQSLKGALDTRDFGRVNRVVEPAGTMGRVMEAFLKAQKPITPKDAAKMAGVKVTVAERCCYFMLKYDLLRKKD